MSSSEGAYTDQDKIIFKLALFTVTTLMGTYSYFAVLPVHIVVTKMLFLNKTVFSVRGGEEWRVYRE